MATYVAVGDEGRILCSGSGCSGTQNSGTGKHLNGVARAGINRAGVMLALAVGDGGTIVRKKTNSEWEELSSGTGRHLHDVSFVRGTKIAWAVGDEGTILKTSDGGSSWGSQSSGTPRHLRAVFAVDANIVWTADEEQLYRTGDGGESWATVPTGSAAGLRGLHATDGSFIAAGDHGTVVHQEGDAFTVQRVTDKHLRAVWRAPGGVAIAVGDDGWIGVRQPGPSSSDEKSRWRQLDGVSDKRLNGVIAWDDAQWVIVGDDGEILTSDDGGGTWVRTQRGSKHLFAVG